MVALHLATPLGPRGEDGVTNGTSNRGVLKGDRQMHQGTDLV
jgi:hypothetical protein